VRHGSRTAAERLDLEVSGDADTLLSSSSFRWAPGRAPLPILRVREAELPSASRICDGRSGWR